MGWWFENYVKLKVRPSSHQTCRGYIANHIKLNIGSIPLDKLAALVRSWTRRRKQKTPTATYPLEKMR